MSFAVTTLALHHFPHTNLCCADRASWAGSPNLWPRLRGLWECSPQFQDGCSAMPDAVPEMHVHRAHECPLVWLWPSTHDWVARALGPAAHMVPVVASSWSSLAVQSWSRLKRGWPNLACGRNWTKICMTTMSLLCSGLERSNVHSAYSCRQKFFLFRSFFLPTYYTKNSFCILYKIEKLKLALKIFLGVDTRSVIARFLAKRHFTKLCAQIIKSHAHFNKLGTDFAKLCTFFKTVCSVTYIVLSLHKTVLLFSFN